MPGKRDADLGRISLVGAGPGDPSLLTLRGRDLIAVADVAVVDPEIAEVFSGWFRADCERLSVDRRATGHVPVAAADVPDLLIERARAGKRVVRLKAGDPLMFGSGCEELIACRNAGLAPEVVPGVSRLFAGPELAGVPLLLRGVAGSVAVLPGRVVPKAPLPVIETEQATAPAGPGHKVGVVINRRRAAGSVPGMAPTAAGVPGVDDAIADDAPGRILSIRTMAPVAEIPSSSAEDQPASVAHGAGALEENALGEDDYAVDFEALARAADTLLFATVRDAEPIRAGLIAGGRSPAEPVALITSGATNSQQVATTTLANLTVAAGRFAMGRPFTLVVGDAVNMREHLQSFERRPLFGLRLAVTGDLLPIDRLDEALRLAGAVPVTLPVLQRQPLAALEEVISGLREDLSRADALVFDSPRAAKAFTESLERAWLDWRVFPATTRVFAVGASTEEYLEGRGLRTEQIEPVDLTPERLAGMLERPVADLRFVLAGPEDRAHALGESLHARGARVLDIPLFDRVRMLANLLTLRQQLTRGALDAVLFFSPADVHAMADQWDRKTAVRLLRDVVIAAYDADTASALAKLDITPNVVSVKATADALVEALGRWRADHRPIPGVRP